MFGHEGRYSNRKSDRGGPTKYGARTPRWLRTAASSR
ncbi:glycosyl hydrolase 108 family protein [Sinorhizobium meliloti]|nr:glycosyl hydrolase 108 family protein [Sinorhizobium meliloti]